MSGKLQGQFKDDLELAVNAMREVGAFTDVILVTDGGYEIKAHKMILAARSPYFYSMFTGGN